MSLFTIDIILNFSIVFLNFKWIGGEHMLFNYVTKKRMGNIFSYAMEHVVLSLASP